MTRPSVPDAPDALETWPITGLRRVWVCCIFAVMGQAIGAEAVTGHYVIREMTRAKALDVANALLYSHPGALVDVLLFSSEEARTSFEEARSWNHMNYSLWRPQYDKAVARSGDMGEVFALGGNAVLLYRQGGRVARSVISGADPTSIEMPDGIVQIIAVTQSDRGYLDPNGVHLRVYAVTERELSEEFGAAVFRRLSSIMPPAELTVKIRNDPWFIDDVYAPCYWPFTVSGPPAKESFARSATLLCSEKASGVSCTTINKH